MPATTYRGRKAVSVENGDLRLTVLTGGGHIAEIFDKRTGVNPLWTPPWPSIEPVNYRPAEHPEYGGGVDASLLAGIMGHSICLDIFGVPSAEEAAAGLPVHGEAPVVNYTINETENELRTEAQLPYAGIEFERRLTLVGRSVRIIEVVENMDRVDRAIGWTQHVTLGPPFLERGATAFRASAAKSKVFEGDFGDDAYLQAGAEFQWPSAPGSDGGAVDLRVYTGAQKSSAFTTHLMEQERAHAFFVAHSLAAKLAFGYVWKTADFPWLGIWEENHSRLGAPWNGKTLARGMEFGVSPYPETRRKMVERGRLFGVPSFRWLPAKSRLKAEYWVVARNADAVPETLGWPA